MVQATAAQSLPTLQKFSGEGSQDDDDSFSHWHESFEERPELAIVLAMTPAVVVAIVPAAVLKIFAPC